MPGLANGGWRNWLLGIMATVIGSLVLAGINFQRDVRKELSEAAVRIDHIERELEKRYVLIDKNEQRFGTVNALAASHQAQLDLLKNNFSRLEVQQDRMLQALDAQYNALNEHLRSHGSGGAGGAARPPR